MDSRGGGDLVSVLITYSGCSVYNSYKPESIKINLLSPDPSSRQITKNHTH